MDAKHAIIAALTQADFIAQGYLSDLTQEELLVRPVGGCNPVAWQLGHLLTAECHILNQISPGKAPELPAGFAEKYGRTKAPSENAADYASKEEYLQLMKQVRAATIRTLEGLSQAELDKPIEKVPPFVKTVGEAFVMLSTHTLMHAGQWAVVRRKCGRAPLF